MDQNDSPDYQGRSVRLEDVVKEFPGGVRAADRVSLEVKPGEFMVFVGPSGCGKTTLLRLICGLDEIDSGEIYIGDRLINDVDPSDRDVAMVFQHLALYPHMTVRENISYALKLLDLSPSEIETRVREVTEMLGIPELLDRRPSEISGGQRQRVALGRELVKEPDVFLFDEPLASLDAKVRRQMRTEIAKLHHELESTIIYVTHDQAEAMALGDKLAVMNDGKMFQIDTPRRVYRHPSSRFVADFLGSPSMNLIEGTVQKNGGDRFVSGEFVLPLRDAPRPEMDGGQKVVLGCRPSHVILNADAEDEGLSARVNTIELLGEEAEINLTCEGKELTALVAEDTELKVGQTVGVDLDRERLHFFDPQTGSTLH